MPEIQNKNLVDQGRLKIQVTSSIGSVPIPDASIEISYTGDPDSVLETVNTDENGQTPVIDLPAPPVEYSMSPGENQPYSEYNLGQSTAPWMMNTTEALMFAPVPIRVFNALILWNGPILAASSMARARVPAPAPK